MAFELLTRQCRDDFVHRGGGHPLELLGAPVLDRVRHPHDRGLEPERRNLVGCRVAKGGGGDEDPGNAEIVESFDVMQTA